MRKKTFICNDRLQHYHWHCHYQTIYRLLKPPSPPRYHSNSLQYPTLTCSKDILTLPRSHRRGFGFGFESGGRHRIEDELSAVDVQSERATRVGGRYVERGFLTLQEEQEQEEQSPEQEQEVQLLYVTKGSQRGVRLGVTAGSGFKDAGTQGRTREPFWLKKLLGCWFECGGMC